MKKARNHVSCFKRLTAWVLFAALVITSIVVAPPHQTAAAEPAGNLVVNSGLDDNADGWKLSSSASYDASIGHTAAGSIKLTGQDWSTTEQRIWIDTYTFYKLTFWTRGTSKAVHVAESDMAWVAAPGTPFQLSTGNNGTNWVKKEIPFYSAHIPDVTVVLFNIGNGQTWFDDFELVKDDAPEYKVTFKTDASDETPYDEKITNETMKTLPSFPLNPKKAGFVFAGWYLEDGTLFTKDTAVSGDATVTAKWSKGFDSFKFQGIETKGHISHVANVIDIKVPYGTDVSNLVAEFTVDANTTVSVGGVTQTSGTTANNFTNAVEYVLGDGGAPEQRYVVKTTVLGDPAEGSVAPKLGINLEGLHDWSQPVFVDLMKLSRTFWKIGGGDAVVDEKGWPLEDARVIALTDTKDESGQYRDISGKYRLIFQGKADVQQPIVNGKPHYRNYTVTNKVETQNEDGTYTTMADVIVEGAKEPFVRESEYIVLEFANTQNPVPGKLDQKGVSNVQLYMPEAYDKAGQEDCPTFTQGFLKAIEPFSTLRFMDWLATNSNEKWVGDVIPNKAWDQVRPADYATQAGDYKGIPGVSFEYIVELSNLVQKDPWICIPTNATDDYVRNLAQLLKETLDPSLSFYLELGNEVWNSADPWIMGQHKTKEYAPAGTPDNDKAWTGYAVRSVQIVDIFKEVYGEGFDLDRCRPVLAWHVADSGVAQNKMLNYIKNNLGKTPKEYVYALSTAPYISEPSTANASTREIVEYLTAHVDTARQQTKQTLSVANNFALTGKLVAYEGGPHYRVSNGTINYDNRLSVHEDPVIGSIIQYMIKDAFLDEGASLFCYFGLAGPPNQYGMWGSRYTYDAVSDSNPKHQALVELSTMPAGTKISKPTVAEANVTVTFRVNNAIHATKTVVVGQALGAANMPADPNAAGYAFKGWFTAENGGGSAFTATTIVNADITVYAHMKQTEPAPKKNLIVNGDFANGAANWSGATAADVVFDEESGAYALLHRVGLSGQITQSMLPSVVPEMKPGVTYKFSAWGKTDKQPGQWLGGKVFIEGWHAGWSDKVQQSLTFDSTNWTYAETFITMPEDLVEGKCAVMKSDNTVNFYVRDIKLVEFTEDEEEPEPTEPGLLTGTPFGSEYLTAFGPEKAFDDNAETYFDSDMNYGYVGIDLGDGVTSKLEKVSVYPVTRADAPYYASRCGGMIQGSMDGVNYEDIRLEVEPWVYGITSKLEGGAWYEYPVLDGPSKAYRYFRLYGNQYARFAVADLKFYAPVETVETYTVTFYVDGAVHATKEVVAPNTKIDTLPAAPYKAGYTFDGWYTEPEGNGTIFTVNTDVTANISVYGKWTEKAPVVVNPSGRDDNYGDKFKGKLGINVPGPADWAPGVVFVDMMKTARRWGQNLMDTPPQLDEAGWPLQDADIFVGNAFNASGTYKLSFSGKANVTRHNWSTGGGFTIQNVVVTGDATNGYVTTADLVAPTAVNTIALSFKQTENPNAANPNRKGVSDVKLIRPGYEPDKDGNYQTFANELLRSIEPFSVIRSMDLTVTNGLESGHSTIDGKEVWFDKDKMAQEWSQRKLPTDSTQSPSLLNKYGGAAWEYVIELANLTDRDVWINVPSNATDDYVKKLAQLFKEKLAPQINLYVEYSNEMWNTAPAFSQSQLNAYLAGKDPELAQYGSSANVVHFAKRTGRIAEIFEEVYGEAAMNDNVRVVLAWQTNNGDTFKRMLDYLESKPGGASKYIYALSIAPYFNEPDASKCTDIDYILRFLRSSIEGKKAMITGAVATANQYGLTGGLLAYEGGPHYVGDAKANQSIRAAVHRDPVMKQLIEYYVKNYWYDLGADLFVYYTMLGGPSDYGHFGAMDHFSDEQFENNPKYAALVALSNMDLDAGPVPEPDTKPEEDMAENPILNGSFEEDKKEWDLQPEYTIDSTTAKTGGNSLKISSTGWKNAVSNKFTLKKSTDYVFSFWSKGVGGYKANLSNGTTWADYVWVTTKASEDWVENTLFFNSGEETLLMIKMGNEENHSGTAWFDDFSISENKIINGSFERDKLGWTFEGTQIIDATTAKDGVKSMKAENAAWQNAFTGVFDLKANTDYELSFYTKGAGGYKVIVNTNNWANAASVVTKAHADWTKEKIQFNTGDVTQFLINMGNESRSPDPAWFDNFLLVQKAPEPVELDYSALEAAIEAGTALLVSELYTETGKQQIQAALDTAMAALTSETQNEVDAAVIALNDAIASAEKVPVVTVDYSALEAAIEAGTALLVSELYTETGKQQIQAALDTAMAALASETQDEVDAAVIALNDAIASAEKVANVITREMLVEALASYSQSKYTKESWAQFASPREAGMMVAVNSKASLENIAMAYHALIAAAEELVPFAPEPGSEPITVKGGIHALKDAVTIVENAAENVSVSYKFSIEGNENIGAMQLTLMYDNTVLDYVKGSVVPVNEHIVVQQVEPDVIGGVTKLHIFVFPKYSVPLTWPEGTVVDLFTVDFTLLDQSAQAATLLATHFAASYFNDNHPSGDADAFTELSPIDATTTFDVVVYGKYDLNRDGNVVISDAMLVYMNLGKNANETAYRCDFNGNGIIDFDDLTEILMEIVRLQSSI